jgi:aminomuconate-semialdehyde/2-hydroxymuconate-6-semialdehyde dehydrogenase
MPRTVGAGSFEGHFAKVMGYSTARAEGGRISAAERRCNPAGEHGWYRAHRHRRPWAQTRTNTEEIWPGRHLQLFDDEEDALHSPTPRLRPAASVWIRPERAHAWHWPDVGIVWINTWLERDLRTPFGGMKQSGLGREGGLEAMRFFTEAKNVCINLG